MKVIFCGFYDFFANFAKGAEREGANVTDLRKEVGDPITKSQHKWRKEQKIENGAAKEGDHKVEPDLSVSSGDGIQKEADGDQEPEQQVQERPQQREPHPDPEDAEQVVQEAHGQPQKQGTRKGGGLVGHIDFHVSGIAGPAIPVSLPGPPRRRGRRSRPPPSGRRRPS